MEPGWLAVMRSIARRIRRTLTALLLVGVLGACSGTGATIPTGAASPTTAQVGAPTASPSVAPTVPPTAAPTTPPPFATAPFAEVSDASVDPARAAAYQSALVDMNGAGGLAGTGGMTATVMSAEGTWTGAAGKSDGTHPTEIDAQFGIASVTKSIVAAQVMQLVEAGVLVLDRPVTDYLPADFTFDTNGATIRQLLSHRSGIPDWYGDGMEQAMFTDRTRVWTAAEVLAVVPFPRSAPDSVFEYADTNYTLLGLAIEHVTKKPIVEVLRGGVLEVPGTQRLIYQPDETPTAPFAMPRGEPPSALAAGGGFLPSLSDASSGGAAGAFASDSISLARWWRAFCAGEVVSQASLTEMATMAGGRDGYGLGVYDVAYTRPSIGHTGANFGYVSWAGCLPGDGVVLTVLANYSVDDIGAMAAPLIEVAIR